MTFEFNKNEKVSEMGLESLLGLPIIQYFLHKK